MISNNSTAHEPLHIKNSVIPCPTKSQNGGCTRNWFQSITAKAGNNL